MDKLLLKLILAAVKAEKLQRALDLTMLLNLPRSIDGAVKIAINDHFPGLAERMNLIKEAKLIKNETDEERNRYSRGDDIWACGGHGSTYRERARSPGRPTSRQQHDPLERAMFGNDNESRPARSPPFRERGPEEPATKPVLSGRSISFVDEVVIRLNSLIRFHKNGRGPNLQTSGPRANLKTQGDRHRNSIPLPSLTTQNPLNKLHPGHQACSMQWRNRNASRVGT